MRSWFSKLTGQPHRIEDRDFGKLVYMGGYWEGAGVFPPTLSDVEYFVTADEEGPSDANRHAFQKICSSYTSLVENAAAVISLATSTTTTASDLAISSLDVPAGEFVAATWEMSFRGKDGASFSVKYGGFDATGEVDVSY